MAIPTIKIDATEFAAASEGLKKAPAKVQAALARAMNRAGEQGRTAVNRKLSQNTGIKQQDTKRSRGLYDVKARPERLTYDVVARSQWTPLSYFSPKQRKTGVSAAPWRNRQIFRGTFMATMRSGHVGVFKRVAVSGAVPGRPRVRDTSTGRYIKGTGEPAGRGKIKALYGPSLAKELHRGGVPQEFTDKVNAVLPNRINHEVQRTLGALKKKS